jgi:hypothetical protein
MHAVDERGQHSKVGLSGRRLSRQKRYGTEQDTEERREEKTRTFFFILSWISGFYFLTGAAAAGAGPAPAPTGLAAAAAAPAAAGAGAAAAAEDAVTFDFCSAVLDGAAAEGDLWALTCLADQMVRNSS